MSDIKGGRWASIFAKLNGHFKRDWSAGIIFGNLDRDPARMERLVAFLRNDCLWEPTEHKRAATIMGENFYGVGHAMARLGEAFSLEQLESLERIPYSPELLQARSQTHVLLPGYPLTIAELYDTKNRSDIWREEQGGRPKVQPGVAQSWQEQDFWARRRMELRWHLIRIKYEKPADVHESQAYSYQVEKFGSFEYVPNLVDLLYARWVVKWSHKFLEGRLRVADLTVDGQRLILSTERSAYLETQTDGQRHEYGSTASAIKPQLG